MFLRTSAFEIYEVYMGYLEIAIICLSVFFHLIKGLLETLGGG